MTESDGFTPALWRRWWLVLLIVVMAIGSSAIYTSRQSPVYKATTAVVVRPNSRVEGTTAILRSLDTLERRSIIATFARIPGTRETRESVANQLGLKRSEIRPYRISASVMPNTNIIKIEVHGPDGNRVAEVANAAVGKTRREARKLYTIYAVERLEEAVPARRPIYPNPQRNAVAAGILGLFLGIGAAVIYDRLRRPPATAGHAALRDGDGSATS